MTSDSDRRFTLRSHPFLLAYLIALAIVWIVTVATWNQRPSQTPELHPVAQGLQYLLVVVAATLAALRIRVENHETRHDAQFGFYDLRWAISDDVGGQTFWTALWIGAAAMVVNIVLLVLADVVAGGATAGVGTYLAWIGAGIAAGAVLGMFSSLLAAAVAFVVRRARS